MTITFEFFGVLQRLAGSAALQMNLSATNATVEDALQELAQRLPDLAGPLSRSACAVGDAIVPRQQRLAPGMRLALLPPVAGG